MAINFPNSPTNGQIFTSGGKSYEYNSTTGVWNRRPEATSPIPADISDLTDTTNLLFDGQYSSLAGAPTSSTAGALGTLTKTFTQNEETEITLSENISPVPNVSVFKEVPQGGLTSKGNWDVNANATNYDFFDEKPISYSSISLTPSATGDGTFTSSDPIISTHQIAATIPDYGNEAGYEVTLSNLLINNNLTDGSSPELYTFAMSPDGTKALTLQVHTSQIHKQRIHGFNVAVAYSTTVADYSNQSAYFDVTQGGTTSDHRTSNFGIDESGTYMYIHRKETTHQYQLSTPWDASTISYQNKTFIPSGNGIPSTTNWQAGPPNPSNNGDYILYCNGNYVARYTMSTAWDITTAGSKQEVDLSTILTAAGVTIDWGNLYNAMFSNDGTLLLVSARGNSYPQQFAYKFNLSTAFDITTAVYVEETGVHGWGYYPRFSRDNSGNTYMIGGTGAAAPIRIAQTSIPSAFSSSDVGKKVIGNSGSAIITSTAGAYKSVTAFADTSTISSWQLFGAEGKADGSGIELSGYSTSTPVIFPTSGNGVGATMNYNNNVSSAITNIVHVGFNSEGTIAIVMVAGLSTGYKFTRYDLSIPFDLSTLTEDATKVNTNEMTSGVKWLWVHPDGTKIWISDTGANRIKYFTMSTAWDPSTASYVGYYYFNSGGSWNSTSGGGGAPSTTTLQPYAFEFNSDGTKLLVGYYDNSAYDGLAEYTLSTAYDMSTMTYVSYADVTTGTIPYSFVVSEDGLSVLRGYSGGTAGLGYSLTLPSYFSVGSSSLNNIGNIDFRTLTGDAGVSAYAARTLMSYDKKRLWLCDMSTKKIFEITGGTSSAHPYSQYSPVLTGSTGQINSSSWVDLDSMVADETKNDGDVFYAVSTDDRTSWSVIKDGDGVRKIVKNNSGTWQYNNDAGTTVTVGFDIANASYDSKSLDVNAYESTARAVDISSDGLHLIVAGSFVDDLHYFTLSTAFDVSTATYVNKIDPHGTTLVGCRFSSTGHKVFTCDANTYKVESFDLSTAYDLSTAGSGTTSTALTTVSSNAQTGLFDFNFNNNGTKLFAMDRNAYKIHEYTLSTAWDITNLTYVDAYTYTAYSESFAFNGDGTKLFILNISGNDKVELHNLSVAFDISTASISSPLVSYDTFEQDNNSQGLCFGNSGQKMYIVGNDGNDTIYQYSTGSTTVGYSTSETWVNGTNNNEHATLQEALGAQSFNRMDKAQLQAVTDPNHYVLGDTLDLMIAPYATSGASPLSDGVTIGYQAEALVRQAINGTDYEAEFPALNKVKIKSLAAQNLKIRVI